MLLAQHGAEQGGSSFALSILALIGMIVPFIVLGVVIWVFWRAKKREDAERERQLRWRSARSS